MDHDAGPDPELERALHAAVDTGPGQVREFLPLVYERLRELARLQLDREGPGHTLQPTALIHETYLKLADQQRAVWKDEDHFLAVAATAMRRILIDHARGRDREKRGGGAARVPISHADLPAPRREVDVLSLEEALGRLAESDATAARIVEMRFYAGMEMARIARVLGVAERTARRHWVYAKAWIARELQAGGCEREGP